MIREYEIISLQTDIICDLILFIAKKGITLPEEIEKKIQKVKNKMKGEKNEHI